MPNVTAHVVYNADGGSALAGTTSASVGPGRTTASDDFAFTARMMAAFQAQGFGKLGDLSPPTRALIILYLR